MQAKVVVFQIMPGKHDEAVRVFHETVIPAAEKQKGFRGGLLLTDPDTGKGISIGLWDSDEDIKASEAAGFYQGWVAMFRDIFAFPPAREVFKVSNLTHLSLK